MEAHEAAEEVRSAVEDEREEHERDTRFRNRAALVIAVLAALLAVAAVLGQDTTKREVNANVDAADTRSTLDARTTQLQAEQLAIADIQEQLADATVLGPQRALLERHLQDDLAMVNRLQSDPARRDGIQELQGHLTATEDSQRDLEARVHSYDLAEVLLQIAIVLASVAILIVSPRLLAVPIAMGCLALLLLLNGLLAVVHW